jgi:CHAD domain-containing protein
LGAIIPSDRKNRTFAQGSVAARKRKQVEKPFVTRVKIIRSKAQKVGLGYWMRRVLVECDRAGRAFESEPVHDLRVALRRCRSLADGLMPLDSHRDWRAMRKSGRRLFRRLGRLRDRQVWMEWVRKLAPANDAVRKPLLAQLAVEEQQLKDDARQALEQFDRERWRRWGVALPRRAARLRPDGPAFQHIALERWQEAHESHRRALRNRSQVGYHELRIALKRFRYTVENFLPSRTAWLKDLKRLQDSLGDVHDLDVLRARFFTRSAAFTEREKATWRRKVEREREPRLRDYRSRMTGANSLWRVWRGGLPEGQQLEQAGLAKLEAWASFLDPRFPHSRRVARLAIELQDGFAAVIPDRRLRDARARRTLAAAGFLHNVGMAARGKRRQKATYKMIRDLAAPIGWTAEEMKRIALVARYHRGAEPSETHAGFAALRVPARQRVLWLAGLLRLADAIVTGSRGRVSRVRVEARPDAIIIWARGFVADRRTAALLGDRKHLLESVLRAPLIVRAWESRPVRT